MKLFLPVLLCLSFAACETVVPEPQPGTVEHQRWLHEQAREHFYALKAQERARRGLPPQPQVAERSQTRRTQTAAASQPKARSSASARTKTSERVKPRRTDRRTRLDETIYAPTADGRAEQREWELRRAREYQQFETREAARLGKTPAQLTRQERLWIRARAE